MVARIYTDTVDIQLNEPEEWMERASCVNHDPEKFFPERGNTEARTEDAKRICLTQCSVRIQCLARVLAQEKGTSRRYGIVGGMSPTERGRLQEKLDKMQEKNDNGN